MPPKTKNPPNLTLAGIIVILFILFQVVAQRWSNASKNSSFNYSKNDLHISKVYNLDASLSSPFLDKVNQFWHVGGQTEIRNKDYIRLTNANTPNKHGVVLSNGIGDNVINDFEVIVKFRISNREKQKKSRNSNMGEGMVVVITPENDFITQDLSTEKARDLYSKMSGGISGHDTALMGFPKNLPGLALVIDTFQNSKRSSKDAKIPLMDAMLNENPWKDWYDRDSDGDDSTSTSLKLNNHHIQLNDSIMDGDITQLRIIYFESISFLKVDVQYQSEGDFWIELFHATEDIMIPKNSRTGQRFIGLGATNSGATENVDILDVRTNEFHWDNHDESSEESYDYVKEVQKYLATEYNQMISMEMNDYKRWKMIKAQPNYQIQNETSSGITFWSFIMRTLLFMIILAIVYIGVKFLKLNTEVLATADKRIQKKVGLLPP